MDRWSVGADSENLDIQKNKKKKLCQSTNQTRQKFSPTLDCDSVTVIFTSMRVYAINRNGSESGEKR